MNGWSETESWVVMGVPLSSRMEILTGCDLLGELWMVPVTVLLGKLVLRLWTWRFQELLLPSMSAAISMLVIYVEGALSSHTVCHIPVQGVYQMWDGFLVCFPFGMW